MYNKKPPVKEVLKSFVIHIGVIAPARVFSHGEVAFTRHYNVIPLATNGLIFLPCLSTWFDR